MNERMKELLKQAMVTEAIFVPGCNGFPEYRSYISHEKFAELIVKECSKIAADGGDKVTSFAILDHFGVEE